MTLPVYYTYQKKKDAKPITILIGLNEVYSMHFSHRAKMIKWFHAQVKTKLGNAKIKGKIKTHYTYHYKNAASDAPNIVSVIDKMFMDALQENEVIEQDNVTHYVKSSWEVGKQDKNNPRLEVKIFEVT